MLTAGAAATATVTVGPVTIDTDNLADEVTETNGTIGNPGTFPIIDGFLDSSGTFDEGNSFISGDEDAASFGFSTGSIVNTGGFDLYAFHQLWNNSLLLSLNFEGPGVVGTFLGTSSGVPPEVRKFPSVEPTIFVYGYDLTDLSVGAGETVSSPLHVRYVADPTTPTAVTGFAAVLLEANAAPVPLPASLPLLLVALGGSAFLVRRGKANRKVMHALR